LTKRQNHATPINQFWIVVLIHSKREKGGKLMTIATVFCIVGILICAFVIAFVGFWIPDKKIRAILVIGMIGLGLAVLCAYQAGEWNVYKKLSREANLQQVPIVGKKSFSAKIKVSYEKGSLLPVALVPGTTVEEQ
jgi:cadmium resistance protein CadD (predicted permease)